MFKGVKDIERIVDMRGTKYLRLTYDSVQETLNRKFILGLKTYRMQNHQFIQSLVAPVVPKQYHKSIGGEVRENKTVRIVFDQQEDGQGQG